MTTLCEQLKQLTTKYYEKVAAEEEEKQQRELDERTRVHETHFANGYRAGIEMVKQLPNKLLAIAKESGHEYTEHIASSAYRCAGDTGREFDKADSVAMGIINAVSEMVPQLGINWEIKESYDESYYKDYDGNDMELRGYIKQYHLRMWWKE